MVWRGRDRDSTHTHTKTESERTVTRKKDAEVSFDNTQIEIQ